MNDGEISAKRQIRDWVRDYVEELDEYSMPEVASAARDHFLADADFLAGPIGELIRSVAYTAVQQIAANTRTKLIVGDKVRDRVRFKSDVAASAKWKRWMEHVGDKSVLVMDMGREDLLIAADAREKRSLTEWTVATLWRKLADKLEGGQIVRERFNEEEVEALYATIRRDTQARRSQGAA